MNLGLKDKVAIISGASKGIGLAIAQSLATEGVKVVICSRGPEALSFAQKEIEKAGGTVFTMTADVTKPADVKKVVTTTLKKFGQLDILINNAGGAIKFSDFDGLTDEDWLNTFQLNVMSSVHFTRFALPALRKSSSARIIQISSIAGVQPGLYNPHYSTAKAALINFSKYLANTLVKDKILVNVICVGPVHSDAWERNLEHVAKLKNKSVKAIRRIFDAQESAKVPLGRIGEGKDVAGLVTFLASAQSSWITGSCFHVDGGKLKTIF